MERAGILFFSVPLGLKNYREQDSFILKTMQKSCFFYNTVDVGKSSLI